MLSFRDNGRVNCRYLVCMVDFFLGQWFSKTVKASSGQDKEAKSYKKLYITQHLEEGCLFFSLPSLAKQLVFFLIRKPIVTV